MSLCEGVDEGSEVCCTCVYVFIPRSACMFSEMNYRAACKQHSVPLHKTGFSDTHNPLATAVNILP